MVADKQGNTKRGVHKNPADSKKIREIRPTRAVLMLHFLAEERKLSALARQIGKTYMHLWNIKECRKRASRDLMELLKGVIPYEAWFDYIDEIPEKRVKKGK